MDRSQVEHVAELARLRLSEEEVESFTRQLGAVLDHAEQLNRVDTSGVEPTSYVAAQGDRMRDDVERESLDPASALKNGPAVKKGFFAVPKVIG
jgi:aspartyl-tRNA(Asn)/glutamyl-tRNA(Gln) amidotransferase subunit C